MTGQKLHKTLLSVRHPKFQKISKGSQRHRTEMHASVDTNDSTLLEYKYLILSSISHASSTTKLKPKSPSTDPETPKAIPEVKTDQARTSTTCLAHSPPPPKRSLQMTTTLSQRSHQQHQRPPLRSSQQSQLRMQPAM